MTLLGYQPLFYFIPAMITYPLSIPIPALLKQSHNWVIYIGNCPLTCAKKKKKKLAKRIIMSNLIYEIIKYQIYEGSHNEEVLQLTEQYVNLKFLNSLIYKTIHEKIMKTKKM